MGGNAHDIVLMPEVETGYASLSKTRCMEHMHDKVGVGAGSVRSRHAFKGLIGNFLAGAEGPHVCKGALNIFDRRAWPPAPPCKYGCMSRAVTADAGCYQSLPYRPRTASCRVTILEMPVQKPYP